MIYGASTAIGRFVYLLLAPVLTRIFAPEDYGVISLIQLAIGFATIFCGMNLGSGIGYYFFKAEKKDEQYVVLATGFWVSLAIASFISGGFAFFVPQLVELLQVREEGPILGHDLELYLKVGSLSLFFGVMQTGLSSMLRFLGKPYHYVVVQLSHVFTTLVTVLIFVIYFEFGVIGVFLGGAVGSLMGFFVSLLMLSRKLFHSPTKPVLLSILSYAFPQMPAAMLNWIQTQMGRYCINLFVSLREQGIYAIGFAIASALILVTTAFRLAYDPFALSVMKKPDAPLIYAKTYKLFICAFGMILSVLATFGKPLVQVIFPDSYGEAHTLIPFLATGFFYLGASNILATGIWVSGKTVFTSYAQGLAFLFLLPANLFMVPALGALGASLAFFAGNLAYNLFVYLFSQKLFPVPYYYWRTHVWVLAANLIFWFNTELTKGLELVELTIICLFSAFFSIVLMWMIFLNRDDQKLIKSFLLNFWQKRVCSI